MIVPAIIITEIRKVVLREKGVEAGVEAGVTITRSLLAAQVVPIDESIATAAADLPIQHMLPLADSLIYTTTLAHKATLWTQDDDFKGLPHVIYFPKKKS